MTKVIIAGFKGRMGSISTETVLAAKDCELVGVYDPNAPERQLNELSKYKQVNVPVLHNEKELAQCKADVWLDFTKPAVAVANTRLALENGWMPVIGTTGFDAASIQALTELADQKKIPGLIVPNFSLSAVLMMEFAAKAVKYLPDVEIIELHHQGKLDAPSGTAMRTAELIAASRTEKTTTVKETELVPGARGGVYEGIHIHSVRLPGLIAHQQVQFGGTGEGLTIRQDSYDLSSFMEGVLIAITKVKTISGLVVGLEHVL